MMDTETEVQVALRELRDVQFCDNTLNEAAEARREVESIIRALVNRLVQQQAAAQPAGAVTLEKSIGELITSLSKSFDEELYSKQSVELEEYWHFSWDEKYSIETNTYYFHDMLKLYGSFCRRWEEKNNGSLCVVERVQKKYLMPKIKEFVRELLVRSQEPR